MSDDDDGDVTINVPTARSTISSDDVIGTLHLADGGQWQEKTLVPGVAIEIQNEHGQRLAIVEIDEDATTE